MGYIGSTYIDPRSFLEMHASMLASYATMHIASKDYGVEDPRFSYGVKVTWM
jgi:hypothetical protein